mmetsp:Transcript_17514/g.32246  ORF Transcript_17514/g.32246 Transcript_17514/m.32246 type:complete len:228 (-) Transcript_17514:15-698(-)
MAPLVACRRNHLQHHLANNQLLPRVQHGRSVPHDWQHHAEAKGTPAVAHMDCRKGRRRHRSATPIFLARPQESDFCLGSSFWSHPKQPMGRSAAPAARSLSVGERSRPEAEPAPAPTALQVQKSALGPQALEQHDWSRQSCSGTSAPSHCTSSRELGLTLAIWPHPLLWAEDRQLHAMRHAGRASGAQPALNASSSSTAPMSPHRSGSQHCSPQSSYASGSGEEASI